MTAFNTANISAADLGLSSDEERDDLVDFVAATASMHRLIPEPTAGRGIGSSATSSTHSPPSTMTRP
jgi:hypothetical protein